MIVSASTECFSELSLVDAIGKLIDLEYSAVEIAIHENGSQLKPSEVVADVSKSIYLCRDTHRLNLVGYDVKIEAEGDEYYRQFAACCRLAKASKVFMLTVPSAELGTPFNEEVDRLQKLVALATYEGARVGIKSHVGCLSEDPDTVMMLCRHVKGLGLTYDPSHYIYGGRPVRNQDKLMEFVFHVQLRDTSKKALQVQVGQGEVEYGRLVGLLQKIGYNRALSVQMQPLEGIDHLAEMRKMRLLLESLL